MTDTDDQRVPDSEVSFDERLRRADLWEAGADERERLADERERLADEREALADERERLADRQERSQDEREASRAASARRTGGTAEAAEAAEAAETQAAVRRAEAAVRRAEAELERTRQAAARIRARAALRGARGERIATAHHAAEAINAEESAWLADRRDFVAAERDHRADDRDDTADRREETAGLRERLADERERELLDRERRFDRLRPTGRPARRLDTDRAEAAAEAHFGDERQRERAAAGRRAAARERARAAAAWGPQAYGPMLLAAFAPLARQLFGNDNLRDVLAQVLKFTVGAVAGCDRASVTLHRHGRVVDTVTTDAVAAELDDIQFETGIGPAPEAMNSDQPVSVSDLTAASRWPVLAATAAELRVSSALCYGLYVQRPAQWSALGALTLYSSTPDAFSDADNEFGSILAAYIGIAVAIAQRHDEVDRREAALHRGLSTRDVIGQAKGILMERRRLSAGDAFDLLRRVSQQLNRKLADVAQELAETGELPAEVR
ncbi:GAF and ANTAR domain-containing protein [Actinoplanes sp. KI2]|uniref:GAF and ANTAR domain-containing protein n=1 Tax=Actinoplanes sp. KI2 TaxID=2983315 RepID=UPI0021D589D9|nr:GAF and ANTAR domain-containing protein [Actinoplanes sp. KI2]MCU7728909.1 GAF and ANTAR domain-containing protein [Actinoplanes sp. KI2]